MKVITTKLKRYKVLCYIMTILFLPIRLPLMLFVWLGEFLENILDFIDCCVYKFMDKIAEIFKWEDIAKKKYCKKWSEYSE